MYWNPKEPDHLDQMQYREALISLDESHTDYEQFNLIEEPQKKTQIVNVIAPTSSSVERINRTKTPSAYKNT